jgi:hypothetical protein
MGLNQSCPEPTKCPPEKTCPAPIKCPPEKTCPAPPSSPTLQQYKYRYGAHGNWKYKETFDTHIKCGNKTFGGDPAPGQPKKCYYLPNKKVFGVRFYKECAEEDEYCYLPNEMIQEVSNINYGSNHGANHGANRPSYLTECETKIEDITKKTGEKDFCKAYKVHCGNDLNCGAELYGCVMATTTSKLSKQFYNSQGKTDRMKETLKMIHDSNDMSSLCSNIELSERQKK